MRAHFSIRSAPLGAVDVRQREALREKNRLQALVRLDSLQIHHEIVRFFLSDSLLQANNGDFCVLAAARVLSRAFRNLIRGAASLARTRQGCVRRCLTTSDCSASSRVGVNRSRCAGSQRKLRGASRAVQRGHQTCADVRRARLNAYLTLRHHTFVSCNISILFVFLKLNRWSSRWTREMSRAHVRCFCQGFRLSQATWPACLSRGCNGIERCYKVVFTVYPLTLSAFTRSAYDNNSACRCL